jgi:hypothetical protein
MLPSSLFKLFSFLLADLFFFDPFQAKSDIGVLELPPKEKFKSGRNSFSSESFVEKRRIGLHTYLTQLVALPYDAFMDILFDFLGVSQYLKARALP